MTTQELLHDVSICFDSATVPWEALRLPGYPEGLRGRPLRRLDDGSLRSVIIEVPAGWSSDGHHVNAVDEEGYLIEGDLQIGAAQLSPGSYFFHPAGSPFGAFHSAAGAQVLMIFGGAPEYERVEPGAVPESDLAIENLDTEKAGWIESSIQGRPTGIKRKVLRVDPETGADTRLLIVPAGFEGRGPNWHPINEEIFCLSGDIGPDDRRLMKPGYYLHNPAYGVHGYHEHSVGGATILEWHDGKWEVNFVDPDSPLAQPRDRDA